VTRERSISSLAAQSSLGSPSPIGRYLAADAGTAPGELAFLLDQPPKVLRVTGPGVELSVSLLREARPELCPGRCRHIRPRRVENLPLLFVEVVRQRSGQLLDGFVKVGGLHVCHPHQLEQPLVALEVLVRAVLHILLVHRPRADKCRVHVSLLGHGVRRNDAGKNRANRHTVLGPVAQKVQQILEQAVIGQDQGHNVALGGSRNLEGCHSRILARRSRARALDIMYCPDCAREVTDACPARAARPRDHVADRRRTETPQHDRIVNGFAGLDCAGNACATMLDAHRIRATAVSG
jgi:hypothetical protein